MGILIPLIRATATGIIQGALYPKKYGYYSRNIIIEKQGFL